MAASAQNVTELLEDNQNDESNGKTRPMGARENGNSNVIYDVEHLATFSTTSNEAQRRAEVAAPEEATATNQTSNSESVHLNSRSKPDLVNSVLGSEPRVALQKLFELEKLSGIWTQRMQIELRNDVMLIVDCETNSIVERFNRDCVTKPEAFNHYNDIYNNIVVFIIQQAQSARVEHRKRVDSNHHQDERDLHHRDHDDSLDDVDREQQSFSEFIGSIDNYNNGDSTRRPESKLDQQTGAGGGELHIFQCVSHKAQKLVADILAWKSELPDLCRMDASDNSTKTPTKATTSGSLGDIRRTQAISDEVSNLDHQHQNQTDNQQDGRKCTNANSNGSRRDSTTSSKHTKQDNRTASSDEQQQNINHNKRPAMASGVNGGGGGGASPTTKPVVTLASSSSTNENVPIVNVNVKETVQVFNQIAALREKSKPSSPTGHARPLSDSSAASAHSSGPNDACPQRAPLGTGGAQLYKQRSVRASLAPKFSANDDRSGGDEGPTAEQSQPANKQAANKSSSSLSSMGSSEVARSSSHSNSQSPQQQQMANGHHQHQRDSNQFLHQAKPSNGHHNQHQSHQASSKQSSSSHHQYASSASASAGRELGAQAGAKSRSQPPRDSSDSTRSQASSSSQSQIDQLVSTNESYVSVLNHCFDDIEKFILRLQSAVAAVRELQAKRKLSKRNSHQASNGPAGPKGAQLMTASELAILSARARGPSVDDYFEILSKFKLAFNLLAKLKGCIHEPNAPELVHFLFTPLAIIIDSARNVTPPIDPALVGIPYLNQDALDLLSNCCTSKESDMWHSLGPNWTQTIDIKLLKASRLPSSFQPIFSDGWAPVINELELIGLVAPPPLGPLSESGAAAGPSTTDGHHHLYHSYQGGAETRRAHSSPYVMDDLAPAVAMGGGHLLESVPVGATRNGRSESGSKSSHLSRAHRRRISPPDSAKGHIANRQHRGATEPMPELAPTQRFSNRVSHYSSYGYLDGHELDVEPFDGPYRVPEHAGARNVRGDSSLMEKASRPLKSSARRASDFNLGPGYSAPQHGPPMGYAPSIDTNIHALEADYLAYQNGDPATSDDYTELHHQHNYVNSHVPTKMGLSAGSSGGHYGRDRIARHLSSNNNNKPNMRRNLSGPYLAPHPAMINPYEAPDHHPNEAEHEAMMLDLGPTQTEWFLELKARGALIVRVLFTREANNDKELTVRRGEILEILDDSRKWWKARNIDLQVGHVPHTIVAIMEHYQTLDELLTNGPDGGHPINSEDPNLMSQQRFAKRELHQSANYNQSQYYGRDDKRDSKTAGAFRYF